MMISQVSKRVEVSIHLGEWNRSLLGILNEFLEVTKRIRIVHKTEWRSTFPQNKGKNTG